MMQELAGLEKQITECLTSAYNKGYKAGQEEGYEAGLKDRNRLDADYKDGLEDGMMKAWEIAREIGKCNQLTLEKIGFVIKDEVENGIVLSWNPSFYVINKYSAPEAAAKIEAYGRKQNHLCDSCNYTYPDCSSNESDIVHAGLSDKIIHCTKYEERQTDDKIKVIDEVAAAIHYLKECDSYDPYQEALRVVLEYIESLNTSK